MPHWEAVTEATRTAFQRAANLGIIQKFYLAGGTGLALHLGHRYSVDLDFFSDSEGAVDIEARAIIKKAFSDSPLELVHDKDSTFVAKWRAVGLSFFELSSHPLVERTLYVEGVRVASVPEIGAMKLAAIIGRGTRRDLVDMYYILRHVPLDRLFRVAAKKYPQQASFPVMAIRGLAYFEDAETFPMPRMIDKTPWAQMKKFLEKQALEAGRKKLEKYWD